MLRFREFVTTSGMGVWIDITKVVAVTFPKIQEGSKRYCFIFVGPSDSDSFTIAIPEGIPDVEFMANLL